MSSLTPAGAPADRAQSRRVVLVHGGLGEVMDAARFWVQPGIVAALERAGLDIHAPDRDTCPESWTTAADTLAEQITGPATVVAGSNGASVAVRLAIQHPELVRRLALLWPATAGDPTVDAHAPATVAHLLTGETLRGVTDTELRSLDLPVAVMAAQPENPHHQHRTVRRLLELLPDATLIEPGYPEAPRPDFRAHLAAFTNALLPHL